MGRKKKVRNSRAKNEEDRISSLPDDLLRDILSRVEIVEAVQTSVLSKRWNRIWATLRNLNFSAFDTDFDWRRFDFHHFVSEFISNRNHDVDVFRVRLVSPDEFGSSIIEKVINYSICHNVEELIIECSVFKEKFPPYFFNNPSLKILGLIGNIGSITDISWTSPQSPWNLHCLTVLNLQHFLFPGDLYWSFPVLTTLHLSICSVPLMSWSLPALTTLHLEDVTFLGEKCWSFEGFIHLKNLTLAIGRLWSTSRMNFSITNLNLTNLTISSSEYYDGPLNCNFVVSAPSLTYFEFDGRSSPKCYYGPLNCNFVVSAPSLTYFEFDGDPSLLLSSEDGFPNLEIVNIDMTRNIDGFPLKSALPPCIFSSPSLKKLRWDITCNFEPCNFEPSLRMLQSLTSLHLSYSILSDLPLSFPVLRMLHLTYCTLPLMSWSLPALKTLLLGRVKFLGDKSFSFEDFNHLKNLTLEMLDMKNCREVFSITSRSLTNLTIFEGCAEQTLNCKFLVSTPNLSCLEYRDDSPRLLFAEDGFPCLEKANIDISFLMRLWRKYCEEKKQVIFQQLISVFQQIRMAKFLKLSFSTIMVLSRIPDFSEYQPSPFGDLKFLELYKTQGRENPTNSPIRVINYLLNKSPGATTILIQGTCGFINYNPKVNMLRWMGSCYSVMEPEDSSSDDDNISSSNANHVSHVVDYSGKVAEHKKVHADEKHAMVQGGHTKDGRDDAIVQHANEERIEDDHVRQDPERKADVVQQEAITEVTKWIPGQVNAMRNIHVNSDAIPLVQGGVNDQVYSYSRKNSLSLWEGHQVCPEFVDLLQHIKGKYPETFEHFAPQTEMIYTLGLNTLCTSVSNFYEVSRTNITNSIITHYRGLFTDLERWGFNTNWLVTHLNSADKQYCSIDHRIDNAQMEVRELQSRLDKAQKEVQELQALRVAKMPDKIH